jgi:RNA polymerase sigma factor (sigma-70 family)
MTTKHLRKALQHFQQVLSPPGGSALTDGQLLARFVANRDEAAFAVLVRRHGLLVFGVCRRVLRHTQDAEDAFQAAFLILARKAGSVRQYKSVGGWLYRVAYHTALQAKADNDRRRAREKQVEEMPQLSDYGNQPPDWLPLLDRELSLLPERYRDPLVLCHLQGRARKEVARQLGIPEGTLSSRLATARKMLARRLSRRGLALSGGALAAALSEGIVSAVPTPLVSATAKVATLVSAGEFSAVSTSVGVLMKGAIQTMLWAKLKLAVGAVMVVMALGASGLVYQASGQSGSGGKGGGRPATELDVLKQEVELLKLKLQVVEQKLKAQDEELRALRADGKGGAKKEAAGVSEALQEEIRRRKADDVESLREAARKSLESRQRKDLEAQQRALAWSLAEAAQNLQLTGENLALLGQQRKSDPLQEAEAALKALREARDTESQRKAADALEKALQKLREQLKKQEGLSK